jgi:hypothetical protein
MPIESLAYSAIVLRSQRPGSPRPTVQLTQAETNDQPVVIPAKAGIQASFDGILDSRLRGNNGSTPFEKVNLDKTVSK